MEANTKTFLKIIATVLIAIVPPTCSYLQATTEMRANDRKTTKEADAGYKALVDSVKELQETAKNQHETILTMRGSIAALMQIVARQDPGLRMTAPPSPTPSPQFSPLPNDIAAAQVEQNAKE